MPRAKARHGHFNAVQAAGVNVTDVPVAAAFRPSWPLMLIV